jgi:tyrosine-protein kinase Etk/Wzc
MPEARDLERGGYIGPAQESAGSVEDEGIDFGRLLSILIEDKWLILSVIAATLLAATAYLFSATPIYKVDALVQVEDDRKTLKGLEGLSSLFEGEASSTAELEILQSRMVLGKVVDNLKLDQSAVPHYFPMLGSGLARRFRAEDQPFAEPWFGLDHHAWGGEKISVESLIVPDRLLGKPLKLVAGRSGSFQLLGPEGEPLLKGQVGKRARADGDHDSALEVFVSTLAARPGTEFVLTRVSRLAAIKSLQGSLTAKEKGKQSQVLEITLRGDDPARTRDTLNEIINIYLRQNVERRSEEAERRLEFVQRQLPDLKQQLDAAESAFNTYRQQHGSVDLDIETKALLEQVVGLESQIRDLELKRGEMRQRLMPSHPLMLALETQIAKARADLESMNNETSKLPDTQQEVLRFSRDVQVNTELYTALLNNAQELRVAKAGSIGTVRIIDHAMMPGEPDSPKTMRIRLLSLIGGLIMGIGLAFLRRTFRAGVEDPDEIEEALGLPVYATVPHSAVQRKHTKPRFGLFRRSKSERKSTVLLAVEDKDDLVVESLRSLRTTLHFAMLEARNNSVLITGPAPGVGKSFISVNFAVVLAQSGKRVLLIDGDLRKGHLHLPFEMSRNSGVSEYVSDDLHFEEVVHRTKVAGLDFIPTGVLPPNPSELLMHERFSALMSIAEQRYDLVLVDSPPVLAATDAVIIGQHAGATLMVVRSGQHPIRQLRDATKRLAQGGSNLRGVIFNDMPLAPSRYGYGYGYGYGYYGYRKYAYRYSYKDK